MRLVQNLGQSTLRHDRVPNIKAGCGILLKCTSMKIDQFMKTKLFIALLLRADLSCAMQLWMT